MWEVGGDSDTNLALLSLRHESRGGGGRGQPGPVPGAVQPGPFDLVVTGQWRVTIASQDGNGVPGIVGLRGDRDTLHALSGQHKNKQQWTHLPRTRPKQALHYVAVNTDLRDVSSLWF